MTTYLSPGVYVEEVPSGPRPIAAAPTSVVAVLGTTRKGPVGEPTRVTGWAEFVRTFGTPTARGHTGESVFGFFENGGPAAWVVRVDPSTAASWSVFDVGGTGSFRVTASSPGTWGNRLTLSVAPDETGASGTFYRAETSGGAVDVTTTGNHVLQVASTTGLRSGDTVALVALPASGAVVAPVTATVNALTPTSITVNNAGSAVSMPPGSVVAGAGTNAATTLFLPSGKGFRVGDVVIAVAPNGLRSSAVVTNVDTASSAVTLTLATTLGPVPGAAFVQRRTTYRALATASSTTAGPTPSANIAMSSLAFERPLTAPTSADLGASGQERAAARLTTSDGRTATWQGTFFRVVGSAAPPSGPVSIDAPVTAILLADAGLAITRLTDRTVADSYGFLPVGAQVTYTGAAATPEIVATRTVTGFDLTPAPDPDDTYTAASFTLQADADGGVAVRCAVAPRVGDRLGFQTEYAPITAVAPAGGDTYVLRFAGGTAVPDINQDRFGVYAVESASVVASRFSLSVAVDSEITETFAGLSLSPQHPMYFAKDDVINGASQLVAVGARAAGAPPVSFDAAPFYVTANAIGADRAPTNDDFRAGLTRLEEVAEPAMVICPDALTLGDPLLQADLVGQVVSHCEEFRRFAIVDAPDLDDIDLLSWRNTFLASTYAALYAPHLRIVTINPDSLDRFTTVPPSGFVAGVFARTDRLRGVHKAPGNETVSGIVGLSQTYTQRRQDLLNPGAVNLIRAFPGRGTRLWGARNATDDTTWRYVNVRRLFNMIETSVERATQWVVFEPNTAQTWIRVKVTVENFLDQQWRAGALAGTKPEQAYRVRVGLGETMTESDIDLGLIITEVAIAPAKPAEFVVFRFSHKRLSE